MERASKTSKNVPSLDEAERVVSFVLNEEMKAIAAGVTRGTPTAESLRGMLALTIAVVGATEQLWLFSKSGGKPRFVNDTIVSRTAP